MSTSSDSTIIIIGAGVAGLSTGIFAQKHGYSSQIFEMHTLPGGLMTSWKRKGYTIDGCIHWLTGSGPTSAYHEMWNEVGILDAETRVVHPDIFTMYEAQDGTQVKWYCNIDRLQNHFLQIAPQDEKIIRNLCSDARKLLGYNPPVRYTGNRLKSILQTLRGLPRSVIGLPVMMKWGRMTMSEFANLFTAPALHEMFAEMWFEEMTAGVIVFLMAMLHESNAGYPIGGSMPMALRQETLYKKLGGQIHYGAKVERILVEDNRAVGIRLVDGSEFRARDIISAADGHATIFEMLQGEFADEKINQVYSSQKPFPPILLVGIGVNRNLTEVPAMHGGMTIRARHPFQIANQQIDRIDCMVYNFDPTLAPEGKTVLTVTIPTDYAYWKELSTEPEKYQAEKERIGIEVIRNLDSRFPGIESQVEMADVATPMTFERYTGNWQASFEGFLPTPRAVMTSIPKTLPGLENFYMVGQWVQAGGGLPAGLMTGQDVIAKLCKRDHNPYR